MRSKYYLLLILVQGLVLDVSCCFSQTADSTTKTLKEIDINARSKSIIQQIEICNSIPVDSLSLISGYNLSEKLKVIPGVTTISNGNSIAKPVIRGLYGSRISILLMGLKFNSQQWQDEHGLGLPEIAVTNLTVIKGPGCIVNGPDALGGSIRIESLHDQLTGTHFMFANTAQVNSFGDDVQASFSTSYKNHQIEAGAEAESNADYSDGHNKRVVNSRFNNYNIKLGYSFFKTRFSSQNLFLHTYNHLGFITPEITNSQKRIDERWSRSLSEYPSHLINSDWFSTRNVLYLSDKVKLIISAGLHQNIRRENEGGGAISLNMHLLDIQSNMAFQFILSDRSQLSVILVDVFDNNKNYGSQKLIPDAKSSENSAGLLYNYNLKNKFKFESGINYGFKDVKTYATTSLNDKDSITPFSKSNSFYAISNGLRLNYTHFRYMFNVNVGMRNPNLAELSSNGLHEGSFVYEIGDKDLKPEQNLSFNMDLMYIDERSTVNITPFLNRIDNYIWLNPTDENWFSFPVARYSQALVHQYGFEAFFDYHADKWRLYFSFATVTSKITNNDYLPLQPPATCQLAHHQQLKKSERFLLNWINGINYSFAQNKKSDYESVTPEYFLLNSGFEILKPGFQRIHILVMCNNILNTAYYNNQSLLKNVPVFEPGRNLSLTFKYTPK